MPEYYALRVLLGLAQFCVVRTLLKRDIGYCWYFGLYLYASSALNIAPVDPSSEDYKRFVQVPCFAVLLVLQLAATLEIFAFLRRRTFPQERSVLLAFAVVVGLAPVVLRASWEPENWYQAFMLARQYSLFALVLGMCAAGLWLRHRPVKVEAQIETHGWLWWLWCFTTAVLASTTKGGMFWRMFAWEGGANTWRLASDLSMFAQLGLLIAFALNLQRWRGAAPAA